MFSYDYGTVGFSALNAVLPPFGGPPGGVAGFKGAAGSGRTPDNARGAAPSRGRAAAKLEAAAATGSTAKPTKSAEMTRAEALLLPQEEFDAYLRFVTDFVAELRAAGTVQTMLAERAAAVAWRLKRVPVVESAVLMSRRQGRGQPDTGLGSFGDLLGELLADDDAALQRLARYEARLERSLRACLSELRLLQKQSEAANDGRYACLRPQPAPEAAPPAANRVAHPHALGSFGQNTLSGTDRPTRWNPASHVPDVTPAPQSSLRNGLAPRNGIETAGLAAAGLS